MFTKKQDVGKIGEDYAVNYLRKKGIRIITRNFKVRGGEIDIIGIDKDTLIFYEVKTRVFSQFGTPLEAITYWKLKSLIKTAHFYKLKNPSLPDSMRIDAVSVELDTLHNIKTIEIVENISG